MQMWSWCGRWLRQCLAVQYDVQLTRWWASPHRGCVLTHTCAHPPTSPGDGWEGPFHVRTLLAPRADCCFQGSFSKQTLSGAAQSVLCSRAPRRKLEWRTFSPTHDRNFLQRRMGGAAATIGVGAVMRPWCQVASCVFPGSQAAVAKPALIPGKCSSQAVVGSTGTGPVLGSLHILPAICPGICTGQWPCSAPLPGQ